MSDRDHPDLADRYRGVLLGLACGDALGGPVEFMSREAIAAAHPRGLRDFTGGGWLHLRPGEITDDTQMTLDLARSLAETPALDMADLSRRMIAWYDSAPKDIGNTTRAALAHLKAGVPWDQAGARVAQERGARSAAGNGSVMRCAPIALRYRANRPAMIQASIDSARVTHADPRCTAAAVAANQVIVHLLNRGTLTAVLAAAADGIDEPETRAALAAVPSLSRGNVRAGGYVLDTLTAALWCLLSHENLEDTIIAAVALGDDTDTTAAVAGALAGARYGRAAIPNRWLSLLEPREELIRLANQLLDRSRRR